VDWLRRDAEGWLIAVHAQPGAKRTEVAGLHGESLKIRLAAPPVEGKANEALLRFIAGELGLRRSEVTLARGETSREKIVGVPLRADPHTLLD
jgi:uncharacterized protein (TIGR00251 family)